MDNILSAAVKLKENLNKEPLVNEYMRVKLELENSEELETLRNKIVLAKETNQDEYYRLKNLYDNHPIIVNYQYLKNELYDLLKEIKEELEIK